MRLPIDGNVYRKIILYKQNFLIKMMEYRVELSRKDEFCLHPRWRLFADGMTQLIVGRVLRKFSCWLTLPDTIASMHQFIHTRPYELVFLGNISYAYRDIAYTCYSWTRRRMYVFICDCEFARLVIPSRSLSHNWRARYDLINPKYFIARLSGVYARGKAG